MKEKKNLFYSSHRLKNHFFLSLTPCLCLSPKSLSFHSLSQITLSPCLSFSPKSLLLSQITHHQALILSTQPSQGPKSLTVAPLSPSCSLSRLSLLCWLGLIVRSDWRDLIVSWLCSSGFLWLYSGEFRGCAPMGFCGCAPVSFVVVRSDLWASGAMVLWFVVGRRLLWIRGGHSVGLWRWGWDYGGVVVGLGLWRWAVLWVCFKWNRRRVQREREEQIEKWIIKKFRYIILLCWKLK